MKRILVLLLAVSMVLSLALTGCGSKGPDTDTQKNSTDKNTGSGTTNDSGLKVSAPGVVPIVEEKVDLEVMLPYYSYVTDYEDNKYTKRIEEHTNVHVVWNLLPETEAKDKLNLLLSSGADLPDVFMNTDLTNEAVVTYGSQGFFIPLNDLIEEHGYYMKEMFDALPNLLPQITAPDGNIYSLTSYGPCFNCQLSQRFWINKTFMDTLGIDKLPETTDEYYEYLKAVKTGDPNGNGKADEIGVVGATTGWHHNIDGYLMCAFIYNDSDRYVQTDESGIIEFVANKPEWRKGLEYMNKLCSEGLLDPVSFTQDKEGLRSLVELEDAMIVASCPSGGTHEFANPVGERRKNYVSLPPLKGPDGVQLSWYDKYMGVTSGTYMISKDCEIPDVAMKWADYHYTEENAIFDRYGEEGVDWIRPDEGVEAVNGGQAQYREILAWGTPQNSHWGGAAPRWIRFGSDAREKDLNDPYELEYVLFDAAEKYINHVPDHVVPRFYFTPEEAKVFAELKTTITDYVKEMTARFIIGDADLATEWDAYVEELNVIGVDKYLEVMQTAFERQWRDSWK